MSKYYPPELGKQEFHCLFCNVYSKQLWSDIFCKGQPNRGFFEGTISIFTDYFPEDWLVSKCQHCGLLTIWKGSEIIYPKKIVVQPPNSDLNIEIQNDYLEAARVYNESPRAAAALLRLALQKLCIQLGENGKNINTDIKTLVSKGLNPLVQKSLDSLRITGNNAVHPGTINLSEESNRVLRLFELLNFIADKMITEPKEISSFYDDLPESAKTAIDKRDKNE